MDSKESKERRPVRASAGAPQRDGVDAAFDVWLQRGLHQLYDSVTSEPIPPELLRLIETDRARRSG